MKKIMIVLVLALMFSSSIVSAGFTIFERLDFGMKLRVADLPTNFTVFERLDFGMKLRVTGHAPSITAHSPTNNSYEVTLFPLLTITVDEFQDDKFNITWYSNATGSWLTALSWNSSLDDGTYGYRATFANTSNTKYWWRVRVNDTGANWENETYHFTTANFTWGEWSTAWSFNYYGNMSTTSIAVSTWNSTDINLTWTRTGNSTHTHIRRKVDSAPSSLTDGVLVANVTYLSFNNTNIGLGTHHYYSFWGYNSTTNIFASSPDTGNNYTNPGRPTTLQDTSSTTNTISLSWTKGTNATRTVVFANVSGEHGYPNRNNGTEKINTTASTGTASGLDSNTTYYFTAFSFNPDSGLWSLANVTDTADTDATADNPHTLAVNQFNATQFNITWVKGKPTDDTVLVRKLSSFPSNADDGTKVYNGSFSSYKDIGLTPATHYYYRAWGWDDENYSAGYDSDDEITRPEPPQDFAGDIDGSDLDITWILGTGATRTIVKNDTGQTPTLSSGTLQYNGTGTSVTVSGTSSIDYYTGWSWVLVDGIEVFSLPVNLLWGGLEINVYKEDEPWIAIGNYTIYILNPVTEEVFTNTSQNNPTRIDVDDVPNGEDINIQVSKDGYKTRTQVMELLENFWYVVNFYLPASSEGSPSGEEGEPWYVNESDIDNETIASSYFILVKDIVDEPIEGAYVEINGYINATANESDFDSYDTVESGHTDSVGKLSVDLLPEKKYIVRVSKDGYETDTHVYEPPEIVYGLYEEIYHEVVLQYEEEEPTFLKPDDILSLTGSMSSNGLINITYLDIKGHTIDTQLILYQDYSYVLTRLYIDNKTGNSSFTLSLSGYNSSMKYYVKMFVNHSDLDNMVVLTLHIYPYYVVVDEETIESLWTGVFGTIALGFVKLFLIFIPCLFLLVIFGRDHVGMGIMSAGLYLGFSSYMIYIDSLVSYISLATLLIFAGIATIMAKQGGKRL